ncbi:MAG TPA: hypothetical protein VMW54_10450 [Terriglobia bacterium]|nr:hypothetical protein [Terriglobia bacterium]
MKRLGLLLSIFLLAGAVEPAMAQGFPQPPQISPHQFALMAWGESPSDPNQLYWMRQAGLNISGFCSPADLDKVNAAGLSCFVSDPRVNGYDWTKMPDREQILKNVTAAAQELQNHPAALGFFLRDEPGAPLMPGLGEVVSAVRQAAPSAWSYINLFPNYANEAQLGTPTYDAYIQKFIDEVHPPFLSYDNYSLLHGEMLDQFYTNLSAVRRLSLKAGIPFWNVVLCGTLFNYMEPSAATFDLQAYSTMAYGGRGIAYFTYFSPAHGNFRDSPVDQFGDRTATWDQLRLINKQIRTLAPWLARLRSTGVYHSDPVPEGEKPMSESRLVKDVVAHNHLKPSAPAPYLIGEFMGSDGHPFLMFVNKDLGNSISYAIHLKQENKHLYQISPYDGKEQLFQGEMMWLAPGAGALFEIK